MYLLSFISDISVVVLAFFLFLFLFLFFLLIVFRLRFGRRFVSSCLFSCGYSSVSVATRSAYDIFRMYLIVRTLMSLFYFGVYIQQYTTWYLVIMHTPISPLTTQPTPLAYHNTAYSCSIDEARARPRKNPAY